MPCQAFPVAWVKSTAQRVSPPALLAMSTSLSSPLARSIAHPHDGLALCRLGRVGAPLQKSDPVMKAAVANVDLVVAGRAVDLGVRADGGVSGPRRQRSARMRSQQDVIRPGRQNVARPVADDRVVVRARRRRPDALAPNTTQRLISNSGSLSRPRPAA